MTNEALLALIVDDTDAMQVLAAWGALALQLDDPKATDAIADLISLSLGRVERALRKLRAARVLVDDGITELADMLLQTIVKQRLDGAKKRGKR